MARPTYDNYFLDLGESLGSHITTNRKHKFTVFSSCPNQMCIITYTATCEWEVDQEEKELVPVKSRCLAIAIQAI